MHATVLFPGPHAVGCVTASRRDTPPGYRLKQQTVDTVRAIIVNSGLPPQPTAHVSVEPPYSLDGIGLPVALAVLLADPANRIKRAPNLFAWGAIEVNGTLHEADAHSPARVPDSPWVGRCWDPCDTPVELDDDALLTIVDVDNLSQAWDVIEWLHDVDRQLGQMPPRKNHCRTRPTKTVRPPS